MLPLANADAVRRRAGYARNPWFIRAEPEPPGRLTHLRQAPIRVGTASLRRGKRVREAPPSKARRLCSLRYDRPFRGYKHPGLTKFQPHGSWAPIWASRGEINASPASRIAKVCNLPLVVGADQSPPGKARVLKARCRALSSEESRAS